MKRLTPRVALGLRIKELRTALGMTQEELADHAGFFRTYMSRCETGAANPTFDALLILATALQVAPAALFEPPSNATPKSLRSRSGPPRGSVSS
jgi:transcriptional regulator with XRE-family HTH domain